MTTLLGKAIEREITQAGMACSEAVSPQSVRARPKGARHGPGLARAAIVEGGAIGGSPHKSPTDG